MHEVSFEEALELIRARDPRYSREAYLFVREALDHTQKVIGRDNRGTVRHVSGQELLGGIRDFALNQFGPMAKTVLEEWNVRTCGDFGEIVPIATLFAKRVQKMKLPTESPSISPQDERCLLTEATSITIPWWISP